MTAVMSSSAIADVSARGGSNDDYRVVAIALGNETNWSHDWMQPDGTTQEFLVKGQEVPVEVQVQRGGSSFTPKVAMVKLELVHPIGYIIDAFYWNTTGEIGGQTFTNSIPWSAEIAHSILNTTSNELSGGIILRATVINPDDTINHNDVKEAVIPVAITRNDLDSTTTGAGVPSFQPARYPAGGGAATGEGIWQTDSSTAAYVGNTHWRHSNMNTDYPSNSHDRLVWGFRTATGSCGSNALFDSGLWNNAGIPYCRIQLNSAEYVSAQLHSKTWGRMGSGDYTGFELWRGQGGPDERIVGDFADSSPSTATGEWSNVSWDPMVTWVETQNLTNYDLFLGGQSFNVGFLFNSDSGGATQGMHTDEFVMFGVEKVKEFTLDINCDDKEGGHSAPPNSILTLHCTVKNNGYSNAQVEINTNVSNITWMNPFNPMLRIDSDNPNRHGTSVTLPVFSASEVQEMWINLSIPPGADVQQQTWNVWWEDVTFNGQGVMGSVSMDVAVTEQYGVELTSSAPFIAALLEPGESELIPFKLQNAGNRDASYSVTSSFPDSTWTGIVSNETGVPISMPMIIARGDAINLFLNVTSPSDAAPGQYSFSMRALCPSCGEALYGNDVIVKNIEVPIKRDVSLEAETSSISGSANSVERSVLIEVYNQGNEDEEFALSVTMSNNALRASLSTDITPILDAWDGSTPILLKLPMDRGLDPGVYTVTIKATSADDISVWNKTVIQVEILDTAAVSVLDKQSEQSYIPGGDEDQMKFNLTNDGNNPDRFNMSLNVPTGMNARFVNLPDGDNTPTLAPGESFDVIVAFTFDEGIEGEIYLDVVATSTNDPSISNTGVGLFKVGSQNWLRIIATETLVIDEPDLYWINVTVKNHYTAAQSVSMDLDNSEAKRWYEARVASNDADFILQRGEERIVRIKVEIEETSLYNLDSDTVVTNLVIWARSNTVADAADATVQVKLLKNSQGSSNSESDESKKGELNIQGTLTWVVAIVVILVLCLVLVKLILTEEEEEENEWDYSDYEASLTVTYGDVAAAPTVPEAKEVPFVPQQPAMPSPVEQPGAGPELPPDGLPEGWTMEQWATYGAEYRKRIGLD